MRNPVAVTQVSSSRRTGVQTSPHPGCSLTADSAAGTATPLWRRQQPQLPGLRMFGANFTSVPRENVAEIVGTKGTHIIGTHTHTETHAHMCIYIYIYMLYVYIHTDTKERKTETRLRLEDRPVRKGCSPCLLWSRCAGLGSSFQVRLAVAGTGTVSCCSAESPT